MKITNTTLDNLETRSGNTTSDGYLSIGDLKAALANPSFDWGADSAIKQSAALVLAADQAGDDEARRSLGFAKSRDGQWLFNITQHDFGKTFAYAQSFGLPAGALDGLQTDGNTDNFIGTDDIQAALEDENFDWGSPQARAWAEYLAHTATAIANPQPDAGQPAGSAQASANALSSAGFFQNSEGDWVARDADLSWFANSAYTGTTLTSDVLDHIWTNGYGGEKQAQKDIDHRGAMVKFFKHLKQDFNMDVARMGASWSALEPERGENDPAAEQRLLTTLEAAAEAGVKIILGVGAKSASDAGQFREVPGWVSDNNPDNLFKSGARLGAGSENNAPPQDGFSQDVLHFVDHVMALTNSLESKARSNIVAFQVENEPFNDMGNGAFDPALVKAEADIVRQQAPGTPIVINHWSNPDHDAASDAVTQAAEIADFVGFDVYAGGASDDGAWQNTPEHAWQYPRAHADGIPRKDGSKAGVFIAELQASTWTNDAGEGFVASGQNVTPLINTAQELGLNTLFWRQNDLEGISTKTGQYEGKPSSNALDDPMSLGAVESEFGKIKHQQNTP